MNNKYWTIVDYPQIKTSEYLDEMRKLLGEDMVYSYYSNSKLDKLCPPPKEVEYMKFEASIEPDKAHLNKSYDDFSKEDKKFGTARQILLLNLSVYKITGERLDIVGLTRTSSLDSDGLALGMYHDDYGQFCMAGGYRDFRDAGFGPREQFNPFSLSFDTIEIGGNKYKKYEVEKVLKDIKPL